MALAGAAQSASATIVTPGNAIPLSGTSVAARPELAGGVLADVLRPFTITAADGGTISGTLQDRVSIGIDGALLFETRIRDTRSVPAVTGAPAPVLLTVVHTSFSPSLVSFTDVDFATDSLGTLGPDVAARGPGILSFQIGFQFSNGLAGGTDSHFFFARTDSPWFEAEGEYTLSDANGNSTTVVGFQPAIPEPASIALLGLPGLALLRRRRR